MLPLLADFVTELRRAGLPVSPDESIDAASAAAAVGLERPERLRAALAASLVKSAAHRPAFDALFSLYFSAAASGPAAAGAGDGEDAQRARGTGAAEGAGTGGVLGEGPAPPLGRDELAAIVLAALESGDDAALRRAARLAVGALAGIEPSRPVGVSYYVHKTLRGLGAEQLLGALLANAGRPTLDDGERGGRVRLATGGRLAFGSGELDPASILPGDLLAVAELASGLGTLGERLLGEEAEERLRRLTRAVEAEVRRRLAAERGVEAVVAGLRRPLLEDVDFMHASLEELASMRRSLVPLTRALAARLARRRRHRRAGPLDFRATLRRSLSTGGVPLDLRYRSPHASKPELVVLADVSGSVASFARFTLMLLSAMAGQFAALRSFLFIDDVDEVTGAFKRAGRSPEALEQAVRHADVVASDGHSDYGRALGAFAERFGAAVGPRTSLLVLGDARNNYHAPRSEVLGALRRKARHLYWLNPEPRAYWGSGDSIIARYAEHCDAVFECRNLRQLEAFVTELA